MDIERKLKFYYITIILSLVSALIGFGYNAWRLEVTEDNNTVRTAAFEVLLQLSQLEQNIYALHYDQNAVEGSPRKGWVAIGLISDLSVLISQPVNNEAEQLKTTWANNWAKLQTDRQAVNTTTEEIDHLRHSIKTTILNLK